MAHSKLLTALEINALPAKARRYADGDGLYIRVAVSGSGDKQRVTKSWVLKYKSPATGMVRYTGLGPYPQISLANARIEAEKARKKVRKGKDPVDQNAKKEQKVQKAAKTLTFGQCAEKYIAAHKHGWTNPAHIAQWHSTFNETKRGKLVFPALTADLNDLPVRKVNTTAVFDCLSKIWETKTESAKRARGRIKKVLDWAKVAGHRSGDNPARWEEHLEFLLSNPSDVTEVENHPSMPFQDLQSFLADLRVRPGVSARALEFMILTATRTGAVLNAPWSEIDFENRLWSVPYGRKGAKIRSKNNRQGRTVPLSDRAIAILKELPREEGNSHIFIGGKQGRGLSNMALLELMRDMVPDETGQKSKYVPHGFRATFKDWCFDQAKYPSYVSEFALWHTVKNKSEAPYVRGTAPTPRTLLMTDWANFCTQSPADDVVTPMRRAKVSK